MPSLPRNGLILVSLLQGLGLLLLWRALHDGVWPSQLPYISFPLWTFVLAWPTLLLLSLETGNALRVIKLASLFSAVLVALGVYIGWQALPVGEFPLHSLVSVYVCTLVIACFKALMYLQQRAGGLPLDYEVLFALSWRNFLVTALAGAFVLGVGALLGLWAALFGLIGIDFFEELFSEDWFLFPVLSVAFGLGIFIFRGLTRVIDGITGLLEGLIRLLLPLVMVIMALFLATLPFTGLAPLWETGRGTFLLLALNAAILFFVNAVYQTGQIMPYPRLVHRFLSPCLALLPIVAALALYGLYLRVDQYGWTIARCWALATGVLLALFSCGYLWEFIRRRWAWTQGLARVNVVMGALVLALMLLVNSPLLDFRSISVASQLGRIDAGEIELRAFDFDYLARNLARPGFLALQELSEQLQDSDPALAEYIRSGAGVAELHAPGTTEDFWASLRFRPEPFKVPPDLRQLVEILHFEPYEIYQRFEEYQNLKRDDPDCVFQRDRLTQCSAGSRTGEVSEKNPIPMYGLAPEAFRNSVFVKVDLNDDGLAEYALVSMSIEPGHALRGPTVFVAGAPDARPTLAAPFPGYGYVDGLYFYRHDGVWNHQSLMTTSLSQLAQDPGISQAEVLEALRHGAIGAEAPAFNDLRIGKLVLKVFRE